MPWCGFADAARVQRLEAERKAAHERLQQKWQTDAARVYEEEEKQRKDVVHRKQVPFALARLPSMNDQPAPRALAAQGQQKKFDPYASRKSDWRDDGPRRANVPGLLSERARTCR